MPGRWRVDQKKKPYAKPKPKLKVVKLSTKKGAAHKIVKDVMRSYPRGRELTACGVVLIFKDGYVGTGYYAGRNYFPLLGGVTTLQDRIIHDD